MPRPLASAFGLDGTLVERLQGSRHAVATAAPEAPRPGGPAFGGGAGA